MKRALTGEEAASALREAQADLDREAAIALGEEGFSIEAELSRPFTRAFAVTHEGRAAGFLFASAVADELHVVSVVVVPSRRRLGLGRVLVDALLAHAEETSTRLLLLEVRRGNTAAIRLYRQVGFVAVRVRRSYYEDGEDAVEMAFASDAAVLAAFDRVEDL